MDNQQFISIKEAVSLSGKSEKTIRRMIKKFETFPDKVRRKELSNGRFAYEIHRDLLLYPTGQTPGQPTGHATSQGTGHDQVDNDQSMSSQPTGQNTGDTSLFLMLETLREQLKEKDKQIDNLMQMTKQNTELIYSLNKQIYQITAGEMKANTTYPEQQPAEQPTPAEVVKTTSTQTDKTTKPQPRKPAKRGLDKKTRQGTGQMSKLSTQMTRQVSTQQQKDDQTNDQATKNGEKKKKGGFWNWFTGD